jgi:hypothetical protein
MHFSEPSAKGDISILLGRGHFYFALTLRPQLLDFLKQDSQSSAPIDETLTQLTALARIAG